MDLEICVDSVESAVAAARGGAQRVELCSALGEGGITPSAGLIRAVRAAVPIDLFVMIRPHGGDFCYSEADFAVMREDIRSAGDLGADGLALGVLNAASQVDVDRTRCLVELARPMRVTFHRAFDFAADMERALEDVIACGVERVLTSGGEADAILGTSRIAQLHRQAAGRTRIMAGGGIRENNVRSVVEATGVRDVHTSLNSTAPDAARNGHPLAGIGARAGEFERFLVSEEDVRGIQSALASLSAGSPN